MSCCKKMSLTHFGHGLSKHLQKVVSATRNRFQCASSLRYGRVLEDVPWTFAAHGAWERDLPYWQILADIAANTRRNHAPHELFAYIFMQPACWLLQGDRRLSTGTAECFVSENVILIRFSETRQRAHRDVRESEHTHDACCERLPGSQCLGKSD